MENNNETTQQEILKAIHENAEKTDSILIAVNAFAQKTDERFEKNESIIVDIQSKMVTKEYLDDKLADLRGDLVVLMRKEDTKLKELVQILFKRQVITEEEKNQVMHMEPFPQTR